MNRSALFKQIDVERALKGAKKAGVDPGRFEIDREGKIVVFLRNGTERPPETKFEKWKAGRESQT